MKTLRSVSLFLLALSVLSFVVAYESYQQSWKAARKIAEQLQVVEVESIALPMASKIGSLLGVMFLVASLKCFYDYRMQPPSEENTTLLDPKS